MQAESVVSSQSELSEIYSLKTIQSAKIATVAQAVKSNLPTLNKMSRDTGEVKSKALIIAMLMQLNIKIKIKDKLEENEIERLADSIMLKYGTLKISDLLYVFNQIADGEVDLFGSLSDLFGSLSYRDVMKALKNHLEIRWQIK